MISDKDRKEIEMVADTIPVVKLIFDEWKTFTDSPYADMYLSVLKQVTSWNQQIKDNEIDLYGSKDLKEFDRVTKYFAGIKDYSDTLDYLRSKMKPEEVKKVDQEAKTPYERALGQIGAIK